MAFFFKEPQQFINELKPLSEFAKLNSTLRVCVTEKCNLNCKYCHKEGMAKVYSEALTNEDYEFIANTFFNMGFRKVKFTGGEPILKENINDLIKIFKKTGFTDVSLITNGTLLAEPILKKLKEAGLARITISLDTINKKLARELNNSDIEPIMTNIAMARKYFDNVKINCVVLPRINFPDELKDIANFCRDQNVTLKILSKLDEESPYPLSNQAINIIKLYKQLSKKETIQDGAIPLTKYTFSDGTIIETNDFRNEEYQRKINNFTYCKGCQYKTNCTEGPYAIRVLPNGDVKPCLIREDNIIKYRRARKSEAKLICLTGLASSGKSSFRELAEEKFKLKSVYLGQILKEGVANSGKPVTYENVMELSKEIHQKEGSLGVLTRSFNLIEKQLEGEDLIVIDSVRSPEEYNLLSQFFHTYLVGVICSKSERFKRAKKGDFKLATKQLIDRDKIEMGETRTTPSFNVGELLGHADYYISGESKDFQERASQIIQAIIND
jgi:cyclic pyranopterin phosphate synthase